MKCWRRFWRTEIMVEMRTMMLDRWGGWCEGWQWCGVRVRYQRMMGIMVMWQHWVVRNMVIMRRGWVRHSRYRGRRMFNMVLSVVGWWQIVRFRR